MAKRNKVEANGVSFAVIPERLSGWHVFKLMKDAQTAQNDYERVSLLVEIACYLTGLSEEAFVDKCGGEDAPIENVVATATELISAAYPKN